MKALNAISWRPLKFIFASLIIASILVITTLYVYIFHLQDPGFEKMQPHACSSHPPRTANVRSYDDDDSNFSNCGMLYIDMGTNVGIQIRKVFEAEWYSGAKVMPYFDHYLGPLEDRRKQVCAFGFEPNPNHEPRLKALETAYNKKGWRTKIFTRTAIGGCSGYVSFFSDGDTKNVEWGGHVDGTRQDTDTRMVDVAHFFSTKVFPLLPEPSYTSSSPSSSSALAEQRNSYPPIVIKVDVEGGDLEVISRMLSTGALCRASFLYVEHMTETQIQYMNAMLKLAGCRTHIMFLDDEYYYTSDYPLPT